MNLRQLRQKFWAKKVYLFDLDGTLYLGSQIIPGALELIRELGKAGKSIFFFTNNSSRSELDYLRKLKAFGFSCERDQVVMSTHSLIAQLNKDKVRHFFLLGTPAMEEMLIQNGFSPQSPNPKAVVVGFDKTLTYEKLKRACFLVDQGLPYYVTHPDFYCPTDLGPEPDCGGIALMIEKATKKKPKAVLGKPNPLMVKEALRRSKAKKKDMILIGDRLMTDILMAKHSSIDSILVLTGDSTRKEHSASRKKATGVVHSVQDLLN